MAIFIRVPHVLFKFTTADENAPIPPWKGAKAFRPAGDVPMQIYGPIPERTTPGS